MREIRQFFRCINSKEKLMTAYLLLSIFVSQISFLGSFIPIPAEAATVTVSSSVSSTAANHIFAGSQSVFVSDQVGYKFFVSSGGACVYSKTTDGGSSWGAAVTVDAKINCFGIAVWYDQWTTGDYGSSIHIATMDTSQNSLWYNRLDTNTDSLLLGSSPTSTSLNSGQVPTLTAGVNSVALTKGTDGVIYMTTSDASDSFVVKCSANCNVATSWVEAGTPFMDLANDYNLLMPLPSGSILLIDRSFTSPNANQIRSRVWNGSTWSASWTIFDTAVPSQTYDVGMAAVVDQSTGDILLTYAADNDNYTTLDHDVRTAKYVSGSWTLTADVFTNTTLGLDSVAIGRDTNLGTVYVAYSLRTTPGTATTGNVYYSTSTSAMSSWSSRQGPVNAAASDIWGLDVNVMSDERIYVTWENPAATKRGIYGNTIADIAPATKVVALGTPTTTIIASSTTNYTGGSFAIKETAASRNVTNITVTESGTIDASSSIRNVKLFYDLDTIAPYDCASDTYSGSEPQFGTTSVSGFSAANGVAAFSGLVNVSPTQAMCVYVVLDVLRSANDGNSLKLTINNPPADILVTGGSTLKPLGPVGWVATTTIKNDTLTQSRFHWRNDNGTEITASSTTGGIENTAISAISAGTPRRLRIEVANKGSLTAPASQFRLEYATANPTCSTATGWVDVNAANDAWNMFNSTFFTNGSNTTDISVASGGVTNDNPTFLVANGGLLDTTSQSGALTLSSTTFAELEYSIVASSSAVQGTTYCFRVTNAGTPLPAYNVYPSATVSADVTLSATGTQTATINIPTTNAYIGGAFVFKDNTSSHAVTTITVTENGTVDGAANLKNIKLRYDLDTTAPYDCASESYAGTEPQFGSTATSGFSGASGSSTFSGSVSVSTTQALCVYVIADVGSGALNGQTVQIEMSNGGNDAVVSGGSIGPTTPILIAGTTTLTGAVLSQTGFHWRNDNGSEATATSKTAGIENTALFDHSASTSVRLRLAVSNTGGATSSATQYRLEFAAKITTCSVVSAWTGVGDRYDDWNMATTSNLIEGTDTTNIATSTGGISDPNTTFLTPNGGVKETTSTTSAITLSPTQFTELEYSITSSGVTAYNTTYCFRVTNAGTPLGQYINYPEVTTSAKRDFKVQRGDTMVTGTGTVLRAGIDYIAPSATGSAFIRITNADNTGAGKDTLGGSQNADDVTSYISNPGNLLSSVTLARPAAALNNTRVSWEIVEFIADPGTDNEMKVRTASTLQMATTTLIATGTAVSGVTDDTKVVVYITGVHSHEAARNAYYASQVTASWNAITHQPVFERDANGQVIDISYAVVEYTGTNWSIQRIEHTYAASGTVETEAMNPVNSLARTFTHVQKRMTAQGNVNNYGHEVWLSSIGAISFQLEPGATSPSGHTSVVWVIENQQTSVGAMKVQRYGQNTTDGTEPVSIVSTLSSSVAAMNNTSITINARSSGSNSNFPLPQAGASLTSTSSYTIWRSEATAGLLTYRTEVIEWPTNGLAVRQNYYRIYQDNNALTPTTPWAGLGENTSITATDAPPGEGEHLRLRMSVRVSNANLPAGLYSYKLQYGLRASSSCSAISTWVDVGAPSSSEIWRGYDATGTVDGTNVSGNPPTAGDLLLSVSDTAGSYVEQNPSPTNPYSVLPGNDYEYDWHIQHNGALARSTYCFRMTQNDGTTLDGYFNYPQIRTASFSPVSKNWHWYDDATSTTPTVSLANENVTPTQIVNGNDIVLRATVGELKHVTGQNIKFKLQYDESPLFTNVHDVTASSSCAATSTWCYASLVGSADNATITAAVLSDADSCVGGVGNGCGTHNTSPTYIAGKTHAASANSEYAFYIQNAGARIGAVYYFRLYDIYNDVAVATSTGGYNYPNLVAESSTLNMSIVGLGSGTTTSGITTTATATPSTVTFGSIPINTNWYAAQRITVATNATEGYQVLGYARQQLLNTYGTPIPSISGTNLAPVSWAIGCSSTSTGCVGYHTTDATLAGGSTRFSPLDSYAGLQTTPQEFMYSSIPTTDVHDIVYRVTVGPTQPAGLYQTEMVYVAIPIY